MNEPEKERIVQLTNDTDLISPMILPYEIGNALSAMGIHKRLKKDQIYNCFTIYEKIPIRLVDVRFINAIEIALKYSIYTYDAYYLEVAQRLKLVILTLDQKMKEVATDMKISILEVK